MLVSSEAHQMLVNAIVDAGFTYVDSCFYKFEGEPAGYSFVSIIGESHVAIHTWPERSAAEITIHYCNYTKNNDEIAQKLVEQLRSLFGPGEIDTYPERIRCLKEVELAVTA